MTHQLEADSIQLAFGTRQILSDIYIQCKTGSVTGLLGRNGQGKSCLMKIIYGTQNSDSKSIRIDKISIPQPYKKKKLIAYLPQFNFIPPHLTLEKIFFDFSLDYKPFTNIFPEFLKREKSRFGLLSGGEKRIVEIYTIVKSNSQFSLLDEPFSNLTPIQIEKVVTLIENEKAYKGFLITDHLYNHVCQISDRIYLLSEGKTHFIKNDLDLERFGYLPIQR